MEFRKTRIEDSEKVLEIIKQAQQSIKDMNFDQWQNGYPNMQSILEDIKDGYGYVLIIDGKIMGTLALSFDGEETYEKIYEGKWLSNYEFAVVHRVAVHNDCKGMGIATKMLADVEKMCRDKGMKSIRIDTHRYNTPMQKTILKSEFTYCGIIYTNEGSERFAYEKII